MKAPTLPDAQKALRRHTDPQKAKFYRGLFKDAGNQIFLGVTSPLLEKIAKAFWKLPLANVRRLMASEVRDERSLANGILVLKYEKGDPGVQKEIFDFYVRNKKLIRGWDGVDESAPYIVGPHLLGRSRALLFQWAGSKSFIDRRIAMVSTWWFIRQGDTADSFKLAEKLLRDREDLIHKAVGWMLREAGKRNPLGLRKFLARHHKSMPRVMLRYAIERFPEAERRKYLLKTKRK
jgi:3-methyladenine DNA glycosylase AlkD